MALGDGEVRKGLCGEDSLLPETRPMVRGGGPCAAIGSIGVGQIAKGLVCDNGTEWGCAASSGMSWMASTKGSSTDVGEGSSMLRSEQSCMVLGEGDRMVSGKGSRNVLGNEEPCVCFNFSVSLIRASYSASICSSSPGAAVLTSDS